MRQSAMSEGARERQRAIGAAVSAHHRRQIPVDDRRRQAVFSRTASCCRASQVGRPAVISRHTTAAAQFDTTALF